MRVVRHRYTDDVDVVAWVFVIAYWHVVFDVGGGGMGDPTTAKLR